MFERWITIVCTEDPGLEEPAATRERLKERFPKNATRRMTQLGLLVGATLDPIAPKEEDTLVYASGYAETRALEGYLDSFPSASPTLFQTSIHPSAVQQALIARQQAVRHFFPLTGSDFLPAQALQVAMLAESPRTVVCGGEERGTWLLANQAASERTFAFAFALTKSSEGAIARVTLESGFTEAVATPGRFSVADLFDTLHARRSFDGVIAPQRRLVLTWL